MKVNYTILTSDTQIGKHVYCVIKQIFSLILSSICFKKTKQQTRNRYLQKIANMYLVYKMFNVQCSMLDKINKKMVKL